MTPRARRAVKEYAAELYGAAEALFGADVQSFTALYGFVKAHWGGAERSLPGGTSDDDPVWLPGWPTTEPKSNVPAPNTLEAWLKELGLQTKKAPAAVPLVGELMSQNVLPGQVGAKPAGDAVSSLARVQRRALVEGLAGDALSLRQWAVELGLPQDRWLPTAKSQLDEQLPGNRNLARASTAVAEALTLQASVSAADSAASVADVLSLLVAACRRLESAESVVPFVRGVVESGRNVETSYTLRQRMWAVQDLLFDLFDDARSGLQGAGLGDQWRPPTSRPARLAPVQAWPPTDSSAWTGWQDRAAGRSSHPALRNLTRHSPGSVAADLAVTREDATRRVQAWLDDDGGAARHLVLVGDPGSGKSTLLAQVVCRSRPLVIQGAVNLSGSDFVTAVGQLAQACDVRLGDRSDGSELANTSPALSSLGTAAADELVAQLARRPRPWIVAVDAVEEMSAQADRFVDLLRSIANLPRSRLRLLLAVRRHLQSRLPASGFEMLDLDADAMFNPTDVRQAVINRLHAGATYASPALRERVPRLAEVITKRAMDGTADPHLPGSGVFLLATLTASLLAETSPVDPFDPTMMAALPASLPDLVVDYLRLSSPDHFGNPRHRDLLTVLAAALGDGLPAPLISPLADALGYTHGRTEPPALTDEVDALLAATPLRALVVSHAQGTLDAQAPPGSGAGALLPVQQDPLRYQLFHKQIADAVLQLHFARDRNNTPARLQAQLTTALRHAVILLPTGQPDWLHASPYVTRHLAQHAAAADQLDPLITDPGFLLAADPPGLTAVLGHAHSAAAQQRASIYRAAAPYLTRQDPATRATQLEIASHAVGAPLPTGTFDPWTTHPRLVLRWGTPSTWTGAEQLSGLGRVTHLRTVDSPNGHPHLIVANRQGRVLARPVDGSSLPVDLGHEHRHEVMHLLVVNSSYGPRVVSGGWDGTVWSSPLDGSGPAVDLHHDHHDKQVTQMLVVDTPGGAQVVSGGRDGTVWSSPLDGSGPAVDLHHDHCATLTGLLVVDTEDGPWVVSGSAGGVVCGGLLDGSGPAVDLHHHHGQDIAHLLVADGPNGSLVVSSGREGTVWCSSLAGTGRPVDLHDDQGGELGLRVVVSTSGGLLGVSSGGAGTVWCVPLDGPGKAVDLHHEHAGGKITKLLTVSTSGALLVLSGGSNGTVWSGPLNGTGSAVDLHHDHAGGEITQLLPVLTSDALWVLSGGQDGTVWSSPLDGSGPAVDLHHDHWNYEVSKLLVVDTLDGPRAVSGGWDGSVWSSPLDGTGPAVPLHRARNPYDGVTHLLVVGTQDGPRVVIGSDFGGVWCSPLDGSGPSVDLHHDHSGALREVVAVDTPDGPRVVSRGENGTVWCGPMDGTDAAVAHHHDHHGERVRQLLVVDAPDGPQVVIGDRNGTVWCVPLDGTGPWVDLHHDHRQEVTRLLLVDTLQGPQVVSAGHDGMVWCSPLDDSGPAVDLQHEHDGEAVWQLLAVDTPDGPQVLSGGADGTVWCSPLDGSGPAVDLQHEHGGERVRQLLVVATPQGSRVVSGGETVWCSPLDDSGPAVDLQHRGGKVTQLLAVDTSAGLQVVSTRRWPEREVWCSPLDGSSPAVNLRHDDLPFEGWTHLVVCTLDSLRLVTCGLDGKVWCIPLDGSGPPIVLQHRRGRVTHLLAVDTSAGPLVVGGGEDGTVWCSPLDETGSAIDLHHDHDGAEVTQLLVVDAADGPQVVSAGQNGSVCCSPLNGAGPTLRADLLHVGLMSLEGAATDCGLFAVRTATRVVVLSMPPKRGGMDYEGSHARES